MTTPAMVDPSTVVEAAYPPLLFYPLLMLSTARWGLRVEGENEGVAFPVALNPLYPMVTVVCLKQNHRVRPHFHCAEWFQLLPREFQTDKNKPMGPSFWLGVSTSSAVIDSTRPPVSFKVTMCGVFSASFSASSTAHGFLTSSSE